MRLQFHSRKMFITNQLQWYSTPKSASKLWVRSNSNQPTQVPINSEAFYKRLIGIILKSDKTIEEQEDLLVSLQNYQKEKEIALIEKETALIKLENKEELFKLVLKQKENETVLKLHYQQLLTVRSIIEKYENAFGKNLLDQKISRYNKWKQFLKSPLNFKPFQDAGFTEDEVCNSIDQIYKRHSADIHSVRAEEGLVIQAGNLLTGPELEIVKIIVANSPWQGLITIQ